LAKENHMRTFLRTFSLGAVLAIGTPVVVLATSAPAPVDEVANWNQMLFRAALVGGTSPLVITRVAAIVQSAVFDAVNGIDRRYTPIHVLPAAPPGASRNAAAVQAAYATLVQLYPAQKAALDARLAVSLTAIGARENKSAIANGVAWVKPLPMPLWRGAPPTASVHRQRLSWEERRSACGVPRRPAWRPVPVRSLRT
jgi:hypothetical protein